MSRNSSSVSDLQESAEHNFALKQISGAITVLKKQRDDYFTDPECPQSLIDSFEFTLDTLKILQEDVRRFNAHCTARRHNRPKLRVKQIK